MALKEFKDYPNTETPIDAENLNFNFNELDQIIDEKISENTQSDYTIGSGGVKCGYQVNGKDVYVKCVNCGALPNGTITRKDVDTGIPQTAKIIQATAVAINSSNNTLVIPYAQSTYICFAVATSSSVSTTNYCARFDVSSGSDRSPYNGYATIYYTL
jgi:hypothetical protein